MSDHSPLLATLTNLRNRILICFTTIVVIAICLMPFSQEIYSLVADPLMQFLPEGQQMIATGVASTFMAPFKLVLYAAFALSIPVLITQVWRFIAPNINHEKWKIGLPLLIGSVVLFYCGIAFAFYIVFPLVFSFFSGIAPEGVAYTPDISHFLSTALKLFLAFGIAFQIPIVTIILISSGITSQQTLSEKRPHVVVICFVVGMLLTPPDIISQLLLALPMLLLFELGLLFSRFIIIEPVDRPASTT